MYRSDRELDDVLAFKAFVAGPRVPLPIKDKNAVAQDAKADDSFQIEFVVDERTGTLIKV